MEESLNSYIMEKFELADKNFKSYSPLTYAYIGDAIFDVYIRSIVVAQNNTSVNKLHKKTSLIVKASTQEAILDAIYDELTDEEIKIFKRGRNSNPHTHAKNASVKSYMAATGFEALIGYLYLSGDQDRISELILMGLKRLSLLGY